MKLSYLLPLGFLCGFISFALNSEGTNADEQPKNPMTQTVLAEGVGATGDEALKDAFRNAVRQVVGAVVDAETLIKNDELISDKVLTYSGGFVKKYDEISKKEDKGLIRIKIKAQVESKSVVTKLKAANVKVKDVDGKGLFAEVVTELDREKDAAALLKKAFEGFPQNCMTISVVGEPKLIEKKDNNATVAVIVQVTPDAKAYQAFVKRLQPVLEKLVTGPSEKGEFLVKTHAYYQYGFFYVEKENYMERRKGEGEPKNIVYCQEQWMPKVFGKNFRKNTETSTVVALCTHANQATDSLFFTYYLLEKSLKRTLLNFNKGNFRSKLDLLDGDGELVATDRGDLLGRLGDGGRNRFRPHLVISSSMNSELGVSHLRKESEERFFKMLFISPTFIGNGGNFFHTPRLQFERKIMLTLDELKKVQKVKVELTSD